MLEHERIRQQVCGCRYDVATELKTFLCALHRLPFWKGGEFRRNLGESTIFLVVTHPVTGAAVRSPDRSAETAIEADQAKAWLLEWARKLAEKEERTYDSDQHPDSH